VYRGLAIRLENYASDGSTVEPRNMALLALEGTIPMSYRERQYNIPASGPSSSLYFCTVF
jgi:hypothetical protein